MANIARWKDVRTVVLDTVSADSTRMALGNADATMGGMEEIAVSCWNRVVAMEGTMIKV